MRVSVDQGHVHAIVDGAGLHALIVHLDISEHLVQHVLAVQTEAVKIQFPVTEVVFVMLGLAVQIAVLTLMIVLQIHAKTGMSNLIIFFINIKYRRF